MGFRDFIAKTRNSDFSSVTSSTNRMCIRCWKTTVLIRHIVTRMVKTIHNLILFGVFSSSTILFSCVLFFELLYKNMIFLHVIQCQLLNLNYRKECLISLCLGEFKIFNLNAWQCFYSSGTYFGHRNLYQEINRLKVCTV